MTAIVNIWDECVKADIEYQLLSRMWKDNGLSPAAVNEEMRKIGCRPFHRETLSQMFDGWVTYKVATKTKRVDWNHGKWSIFYTITDFGKQLVTMWKDFAEGRPSYSTSQ